jgi:hypothetical protein
MNHVSKNQLRKSRDTFRQLAWEAYVTLLRFPIEVAPAYIDVLDKLRAELAYSMGAKEEKIFEEAKKVVEVLGEIRLIDVKPHVE